MYIARQPILDRDSRVAGYELLFRAGAGPIADGRYATANVVQKVFLDAGFGEALGPHPGFVNVDADFLLSEEIELLPPGRAVLELLESVEFTSGVVARCRDLRARGYRLAADDWAGDRAAIAPVLGLLDIVKVDLPRLAEREPAALARELPGKTLLAEKVETEAEFRRFRDAGFALFQGYHFARPERVGDAAPDPVRLGALRVLARLADEDADETALEEEIKREPRLALGLLRFANPASAGLARPIASLREALLYVGRRQLRLWLQLLVYLGAAGGEPARAPLLQLAAVRGKAMEILARRLGRTGERAFLAGIVSLFHVALGIALEELLGRLALDAEIAAALRERSGELGALLALAEAMERADDAGVSAALARLPGLRADDLLEASREALRWAGGL